MALWYYRSEGMEHGPISAEELRDYISGSASPTDTFTSEAMSDWVFASEALEILDGGAGVRRIPFVDDEGDLQCTRCGSKQLHSAKRGYRFWRGGIFGMHKVIITCLKCGTEFLPGGERY